jgi:hypothetical protein
MGQRDPLERNCFQMKKIVLEYNGIVILDDQRGAFKSDVWKKWALIYL